MHGIRLQCTLRLEAIFQATNEYYRPFEAKTSQNISYSRRHGEVHLRATVLAFPFNDTQTVIQWYVPFRSVLYLCHFSLAK